MPISDAKILENPSSKRHKLLFGTQICLRIFTVAFTLAATWIVVSTKQTIMLFGMNFDARYTYSVAFKFFVFANAVACAFSAVTMLLLFFLRRYFVNPGNYFVLFLHDLFALLVVLSGCAAATAIGYVGQYGNIHSGWSPICDHFHYYCKRVTIGVAFSYLAVILFLILTIFSASKARQTQL